MFFAAGVESGQVVLFFDESEWWDLVFEGRAGCEGVVGHCFVSESHVESLLGGVALWIVQGISEVGGLLAKERRPGE